MERCDVDLLFSLVHASLESAFEGKEMTFPHLPPSLEVKRGAFVTIQLAHQLRGCIGYMAGIMPLGRQIATLAREAAFEDYRFPSLTAEEYRNCTFELSILTPMHPIATLDEFELGKMGILMEEGAHHAVFLPQVATETGWTKDELLAALSQKAGLAPDAYLHPDATFQTFTAEVYHEM